MSQLDRRKRVRIRMGADDAYPSVTIDGERLDCVSRIEIDHSAGDAPMRVRLTLIGVDIDLEGAPEHLVKIVGPSIRPKPG